MVMHLQEHRLQGKAHCSSPAATWQLLPYVTFRLHDEQVTAEQHDLLHDIQCHLIVIWAICDCLTYVCIGMLVLPFALYFAREVQ